MIREHLNCVCVIQARRGSSRLPDKILKPLAGKPVLERVIERCKMIEGVDKVICAIPDDSFNDPVETLALAADAEVFRGSEQDVLSRYWGAVEGLNCAYVMRVTADCPLLDPEVCATLLLRVAKTDASYGATALWPHGLDCEVFEKALLREAYAHASHPADREHVTLWMKRRPEEQQVHLSPGEDLTAEHRWVLDYPEDLLFLTELFSSMPSLNAETGWREVLNHVNAKPELRAINRQRIHDWAVKTKDIYEATNST